MYEEFDRQLFKNTCKNLVYLGYDSILIIQPDRIIRYSFKPSVSLDASGRRIMQDTTGANYVYYDVEGCKNLRLTWKEFVDRFIYSKTKRLLKHIRGLDETENSI